MGRAFERLPLDDYARRDATLRNVAQGPRTRRPEGALRASGATSPAARRRRAASDTDSGRRGGQEHRDGRGASGAAPRPLPDRSVGALSACKGLAGSPALLTRATACSPPTTSASASSRRRSRGARSTSTCAAARACCAPTNAPRTRAAARPTCCSRRTRGLPPPLRGTRPQPRPPADPTPESACVNRRELCTIKWRDRQEL